MNSSTDQKYAILEVLGGINIHTFPSMDELQKYSSRIRALRGDTYRDLKGVLAELAMMRVELDTLEQILEEEFLTEGGELVERCGGD